MLTQPEFLEILRPLLQEEGTVFQKNKNVFARPAKPGEQIRTQTSDGLETTNTAGDNHYVVRNQTGAGEEYLVPGHKFVQRYQELGPAHEEWVEYQSLGKVVAVELTPHLLTTLNLKPEFEFMAKWGEPMVAKAGDYLCSPPDFTEVYRIARKEFLETYKVADE